MVILQNQMKAENKINQLSFAQASMMEMFNVFHEEVQN